MAYIQNIGHTTLAPSARFLRLWGVITQKAHWTTAIASDNEANSPASAPRNRSFPLSTDVATDLAIRAGLTAGPR